MPPLRLLYVMDPMSRVLVDKDTTFAFQLEGQKRGHEQYHCEPQALFVERTVPHATVRRVEVERAAVPFHLFEARTVPLGAFDVVFMRKDPPFDMAFFFATHLLGLVDAAAHPGDERAARAARREREALRAQLPRLIPESLVTADIDAAEGVPGASSAAR